MLDRNIEQSKVVVKRHGRRIADRSYHRADLEQQTGLPVTQQRRIGAGFSGRTDRDAETMALVFETRPPSVQFRHDVARAFGHRPISCQGAPHKD